MRLRLGVHNVTLDRFWELYEDVPSWSPSAFEWSFDDVEVRKVGKVVCLYEDPSDRWWSFGYDDTGRVLDDFGDKDFSVRTVRI